METYEINRHSLTLIKPEINTLDLLDPVSSGIPYLIPELTKQKTGFMHIIFFLLSIAIHPGFYIIFSCKLHYINIVLQISQKESIIL